MKPAHMIALVIIAVTLAVTLFTFANSVAPNISITEAMARPGELVQVRGTILRETVRWVPEKTQLIFDIREVVKSAKGEEAGDKTMTVVYGKVKPDSFDEAKGVDVVGRYSAGVFKADTLLVKCPTKYIEERAQSTADARR